MTALPELRDGFKFRSGHPALDLAATLAGRLKPVPTDLLATPADLDRWLRVAELPPPSTRASRADLADVRALRESVYRLGRAAVDGKRFPPTDIVTINRLAAKSRPAPQLGPGGLAWRQTTVRHLIALLAGMAVELLAGEAAQRIRACGGAGCSILFLDGSRGGDRRWCSMQACGNRAKLAAFRRRQEGD